MVATRPRGRVRSEGIGCTPYVPITWRDVGVEMEVDEPLGPAEEPA